MANSFVRLRGARVLTALAVLGLCGLTMVGGLNTVLFCIAGAAPARDEDRAAAVRPWAAVPGLAGAALQASLTSLADTTDIDGARARAEHVAALLAVKPSSSMNWLALAGMRLAAGQPTEKVLAALAMSSLTGANQGDVMSQRGILGLLKWEILPPDVRRRVVADIAGAILGNTITNRERNVVERILEIKSPDARQEIMALFHAEGLAARDLARIGL
jgi:hypothetical protein